MKMKLTTAAIFFSIFILAGLSSAQNTVYYPDGQYDPAIPKIEDILGYKPGEQFTPHYLLERYLERIADATPRVTLHRYGYTNEQRGLYNLIITDPANRAKLDVIKANIKKLVNARDGLDQAAARKIIAETPVIVWLNYNVHGNESCGTEAAIVTLYHLAAGTDEATRNLLKNAVIIIDPCVNPDGRERYVHWYKMQRGNKPDMDRFAAEHREPWPGGRTNHYLFDLNRDWAWLTQVETAQRLPVYREWMPQVFVDFHEMGAYSSYFFFPSAKPKNPNLDKETLKWEQTFGKANADAFDKQGWEYFSAERFDLYYPGYGDSWPSFNGATGMTYEQGGSGTAGLIYQRDDKTKLSLWDRLQHHYVASITTAQTAVKNKTNRMLDFYRFYANAYKAGKQSVEKAYILTEKHGKDRALDLAKLLTAQGITVGRAKAEFSAGKTRKYYTTGEKKRTFPAGTYIVQSAQPEYRLMKTLLEPETALPDTFFYDIAAWSLPVAYGVESYIALEPVNTAVEPVTPEDKLSTQPIKEPAAYAYLAPWKSLNTGKFASALLQKDFVVEYAAKEFTLNGRKYNRGTIIIKTGRNKDTVHEAVKKYAEKYGVDVYTTATGYSEKGIDLGSGNVVKIKKPNIGLLKDEFISSSSFGAAWHLFDNTFNFNYSIIPVSTVAGNGVNEFTTLVFPSDRGGRGYKRALDSTGIDNLKNWIRNGGTYIGFGGGAFFASEDVGKFASVKIKKPKKPEGKQAKEAAEKEKDLEKRKKSAVKEQEFWHRVVPGIIVKMQLDNTHPLGYGMENEMYVFKQGTRLFELSSGGDNVGIIHKSPKVAGYISDKNAELIGDGLYLYHQRYGRGHIILFTDDPNFRGFLLSHKMLLLNAILFGAN